MSGRIMRVPHKLVKIIKDGVDSMYQLHAAYEDTLNSNQIMGFAIAVDTQRCSTPHTLYKEFAPLHPDKMLSQWSDPALTTEQ